MKAEILALLVIVTMAPVVQAAPKSRQSGTASGSKEQPETQAKAWWLEWRQKHPEAADMTWESLEPEYKEEVEARVVEDHCRTSPGTDRRCLEAERGGYRPLPGEDRMKEEADQAKAEEAAEETRCAANSKCETERIARVVCENIANQAAVKTEIKCRHQLLDSKLMAPARSRRARMNSACPEHRSDFSEYDTFGELNALVEEFETAISEQKTRYRDAAKKAFSERICRGF